MELVVRNPEPAKTKFPPLPPSWFHFSSSEQLSSGPIEAIISGQSFVGFRTESGKPAVLSGRCSHMGAALAAGCIKGEVLACPLHGWEYGADGVCQRIPGADSIPPFARQQSFPVEKRGGHIFFFSRSAARFPCPFFDGLSPAELLPARPFELVAESPWYFVGANGFDIQHFRMAHDRTLLAEPEVTNPSPFARRIVAEFAVSGTSIHDRIIRCVAGPRVIMDITVWAGILILVRASFARTTTFGMFNVLPLDERRTLGRVIVWVRRSQSSLQKIAFDWLNAALRRKFIEVFLRSDLPRIAGLRYQPQNLIAQDNVLADYFAWLENVTNPAPKENA